ncbi:MAG TPA: glutamate--tRNA ligase [Gemmatimonadales bacterium]|nr:glutamate--tRNA ligase [Gemmatimonadales bacterium]HRZ08368.1 glutamate--tRNA ligase [Gemmatimonadales bacterium]
MSVRVRFAPSPTGYLHVGGARTALFNWLYARKMGGVHILRIEDTDRERSTEAHTQVILDGLRWLGIEWDEGPYFQGAFGARHRADAERLLAEGKAYRCFCTTADLDAQRKAMAGMKTAFRYDGRCGRLGAAEVEAKVAAGTPSAIRFRMPQGEIAWDDAVHGRISFQGHDLDDLVILRSDHTPIYNLAVVSDDIEMRITHVIRGDDHVSNTPKQIALYRALGHEPPVFAHVPMILGDDGKKLSKRHGATAVGDYQDKGILPAAMRNFLALLGWSPGGDREILPEAEMIAAFSLEGIQKKPAVFDTAKLEWMNGQYLSQLSADALLAPTERELARMGVTAPGRDLRPLIDSVKARSRTILNIAEQVAVRLDPSRVVRDAKGEQLAAKLGTAFSANLAVVADALDRIPAAEWHSDRILADMKALAEARGAKLGDLLQPVRVVLTGSTVSEPVNDLLVVVGREESLARLNAGVRT